MTPRPRVVVVAPEPTVAMLRDLVPAADIVPAHLAEVVVASPEVRCARSS